MGRFKNRRAKKSQKQRSIEASAREKAGAVKTNPHLLVLQGKHGKSTNIGDPTRKKGV